MFEDLSIGKLLIIFLVIIILFGAKKIPDLAQGLGKGIREFKKALKDED
jgi:sec-independent protein translocase protein TatA